MSQGVRSLPRPRSQDSTGYQYQPLSRSRNEIRLLKLDVSRPDQHSIAGTLRTFQLARSPPYKALSYEWGADQASCSLLVAGKRLKIGQNLRSFLQHYRQLLRSGTPEHLDPYLWIDQICINQKDVRERNHQVHLMSKIYTRNSTLAWVGTTAEPGLRYLPESKFQGLVRIGRSNGATR